MESLRTVIFLIGCLGTRVFLAWLAYRFPAWLPLMGWLALGPALSLFLIWAMGWRKVGTFAAPIWDALRPIHGTLLLIFALMAIAGIHQYAWLVLALDAVISLVAFVTNIGAVHKR